MACVVTFPTSKSGTVLRTCSFFQALIQTVRGLHQLHGSCRHRPPPVQYILLIYSTHTHTHTAFCDRCMLTEWKSSVLNVNPTLSRRCQSAGENARHAARQDGWENVQQCDCTHMHEDEHGETKTNCKLSTAGRLSESVMCPRCKNNFIKYN